MFSVRRQSGTVSEGVGHAEAGIRTLLRPDHREQRSRRNDRPAGSRDRARAHDTSMGARFLGLLTAVFADSSDHHHGLQRLVEDEAVIAGTITAIGSRSSLSSQRSDGDADSCRHPTGTRREQLCRTNRIYTRKTYSTSIDSTVKRSTGVRVLYDGRVFMKFFPSRCVVVTSRGTRGEISDVSKSSWRRWASSPRPLSRRWTFQKFGTRHYQARRNQWW